MEATSPATEDQHSYPVPTWASKSASTNSVSSAATILSTDGSQDDVSSPTSPFPAQIDFIPFYYPHQSVYQAQLLHYNKLISSRGPGLHLSALPPVLSSHHIQPSIPRSSGKASITDGSSSGRALPAAGYGNRPRQNSEKSRSNAPNKDLAQRMPAKKSTEATRNAIPRSVQTSSAAIQSQSQSHSSSVPSTPRQHARQFSFGSREPSPNANANHSPRSAYSETNSTLPSLRPLPPRNGGCKYETAMAQTRRRIPYTTGNERLERLDLRTIKETLSKDEEAKLAKDMQKMYQSLLPTPAVEDKRKKLVRKLDQIFNHEWPGHNISCHVFGSSGNLLCHDGSDVDLCITTEWKEMESVCKIADLLARKGMQKVVCISQAKVPIVKIWDPELELACDMNVNNTLALENTRMIRIYMEIDPRVRQLAMIVKHWTRRRIINDAGIGGTLSSYTWICLIIAFLQLRTPPILPALHQSHHKLKQKDGSTAVFADDLKKLRGFGSKNRASSAELLFQFFRFYAHEFDYSKNVLSIRTGRLLPKTEKKWDIGMSNSLCVEEPFNTSRNLGNTADEYSFRGLHQELRRAFDSVSVANLDDACEQFIFPKEEERVFSRPPQQSRPVLLRSSSQSNRGGRGNNRSNRHNNFHRNGGGSSRRASSSVPTYDNMYMSPIAMAQDMSWYPTQYAFQYTQQDLMTQMAFQQNMNHLYGQTPYLQHSMSQRSNSAASLGQSSERSRTNSFDAPPMSTQMRPDMYSTVYGIAMNQSYYPTYGTYPSTPVTGTSSSHQDFRRSMSRSNLSSEINGVSSGALARSQSQPASRSPAVTTATLAYPVGNIQAAAVAPSSAPRIASGVSIPSFLSDETDVDDEKGPSESPTSQTDKTRVHPEERLGPAERQPNGIAFGDINTDATGMLTEEARRSPSPNGRSSSLVAGFSSAPLLQGPFPTAAAAAAAAAALPVRSSRPMVVNGSGMQTATNTTTSQAQSALESSAAGDMHYDNPLQVNSRSQTFTTEPNISSATLDRVHGYPGSRVPGQMNGPSSATATATATGYFPATDSSFRERIAMLGQLPKVPPGSSNLDGSSTGTVHASPKRRPNARQTQSGVIAPLDLALTDEEPSGTEHMAHLSPVYEMRTPSPTMTRVFDNALRPSQKNSSIHEPNSKPRNGERGIAPLDSQKGASRGAKHQRGSNAGGREHGHVRGAKSENDGGWQKAGKGKKKNNVPATVVHGENNSGREFDRRGG